MQNLYLVTRQLFLIAGFCLLCISTKAQGWQRFEGGAGDQRAFSVRLTADGGLVALGSSSDSTGVPSNWYAIWADSLGNITTSKTWGSLDSAEYGLSIMALDSQMLVLGNVTYPFIGPAGLNQRGAILWNTLDAQGNVVSTGIDNEFITVAEASTTFGNGHLIYLSLKRQRLLILTKKYRRQ